MSARDAFRRQAFDRMAKDLREGDAWIAADNRRNQELSGFIGGAGAPSQRRRPCPLLAMREPKTKVKYFSLKAF